MTPRRLPAIAEPPRPPVHARPSGSAWIGPGNSLPCRHRCATAGLLHVGGDVRDRRGAGGALAAPQDLGQEGPKHDRGGEDIVLRKQGVVLGEGPLDGLAGQNLGERQTGLLKERLGDGVKLIILWASVGLYNANAQNLVLLTRFLGCGRRPRWVATLRPRPQALLRLRLRRAALYMKSPPWLWWYVKPRRATEIIGRGRQTT